VCCCEYTQLSVLHHHTVWCGVAFKGGCHLVGRVGRMSGKGFSRWKLIQSNIDSTLRSSTEHFGSHAILVSTTARS
jgi:hypothetical protein